VQFYLGQHFHFAMNESQAPNLQGMPASNRFVKFAAVFSIFPPLIAIFGQVLLFLYLRSHGHTNIATVGIIELLIVILMVLGLIFGIVALAVTNRSERKGIFGLAITGICLNIFLLVSLIALPLLLPLTRLSKFPITVQGRLDRAKQELAEANTDEKRFYALDGAAKESFNVGNIQDAQNYANELLKMATSFKANWNYGNAIQDGNLVLGRIAARNGQIEEAKKYLLQAGKSPGSPQMDSFGPNMSLAKDLLEKGERDSVLQYFELCRKFWSMDYGKLDEWSKDVKAGQIPDFGANLVY
jgi:hypothetical protein